MKRCGYSFWGFLGDRKYDAYGKLLSTPDGNAFYSWSIIMELQNRGYEVVQVMPDRDLYGTIYSGKALFESWAKDKRLEAYSKTIKIKYEKLFWLKGFVSRSEIRTHAKSQNVWQTMKKRVLEIYEEYFGDIQFILHEYRMLIPGRNDIDSVFNEEWQPDYLIQECLFEYCCKEQKRLILFDLDYKLDCSIYRDLRRRGCPAVIFELGTKWQRTYADIENGVEIRKVYIPFDFDSIDYFDILSKEKRQQNLIYVGNRYERDWCIDKYIPENLNRCTIYGNWLEGDRDSAEVWSRLNFGRRLQTGDMASVYQDSLSTILLAKAEYCEYGFMTARIVESIFYGTVPFFIEEYGKDVIKEYAGHYADFLTVVSKEDVIYKIKCLRKNGGPQVKDIVGYLRNRLDFMDVKNFVDILLEVK